MNRQAIHRLACLAIALCILPSPCFAGAAAGRSIEPSDLKREIDEARSVQKELRVRTGLPAEIDGDHVSVTSFGGLASGSSTVALRLGEDGLWRVDQVEQPFNFKTNRSKKPKRRSAITSRARSDQVMRLVAGDAIYGEPPGLDGGCTDQPLIAIEIVFKGRRRNAVRTGCPPEDLTWRLVEAVYGAEPKGAR